MTESQTRKYVLPYLNYKIIASGSKGNAVRIGEIMIDCGVPYKAMKTELMKCKVLFITHIHSDHVAKPTLDAIKRNHPLIKIIGNYQVAEKYGVDIISNKHTIGNRRWKLTPFYVPHDVVTQGAVIDFIDAGDTKNCRVIYVTDSAGTDKWIVGKYDYLFIESNHDEKLIALAKPSKYGYNVKNAAYRHTSTQKSKAFYYMNRADKQSPWIELHKSERFYR